MTFARYNSQTNLTFFIMKLVQQDQGLQQERLYFFQFPAPFPTFVSEQLPTHSDTDKSEPGNAPGNESKRVSFSADTKPPAAVPVPEDVDKEKPPALVDGVIGQLEIYQSGAVKMRLANGILLDVSRPFRMISSVT